ncbi:MAG: SDR family NAD(P)-dependent oxidoreductase [Chiayiivirga sp.]|jgi:NAD(P)-dependent dehydrogenase (short-subunit alcohol dehydrogenase family)|nr:SDR family NAD(P)-dependent oxidoreductase [Chiayiivirga sp.]
MAANDGAASPPLANRVILITGANGGLGEAVARASAAAGANVVLLGRRVPRLTRLHDELEAAGCRTPSIYPMDLSGAVPEDYDVLARAIANEYGRLDGIVHCAAELKGLSSLQNLPLEDWFTGLHVNLTAPFLLTRACLPLLREREDACVLFALDDAQRTARAFWGPYGVAKHALRGLVSILADELENSPIRVHGVEPGPMRSALRARAFFAEDASTLPDPSAYARACVQLLAGTDRAAPRFVTLQPHSIAPRSLGLATFAG